MGDGVTPRVPAPAFCGTLTLMANEPVPPPVPRRQRFYTSRDWFAAGLTGGVALIAYVCTLAPSVTLEDAGELATAAFQLGVPHAPGAPLWTLAAWLWWHLIPFGNIAWRLNLFSAVTSAAACGLVTLLVSKSGRMLGMRAGFFRAEDRTLHGVVVPACAICAGLLLAFSPVLWTRAIVTETSGGQALGWLALLVVLYRWSFQLENRRWLYVAAGLWGAGVTTDWTAALLVVALPALVWLVDRGLGRGLLAAVLSGILVTIAYAILQPGSLVHQGWFPALVVLAIAFGAGYWLRLLGQQGPGWLESWRPMLGIVAAAGLGLLCAGWLWIAANANPPVNWGNCGHWRHWLNYVTGAAEARVTSRELWRGWGQLNLFFSDLQSQFNIAYALLALPVVFFYRDLAERDRQWIKFLLLAFFSLSFGYLFLANPVFDSPRREWFLPAHCVYTLWIGCGLLLGLGMLFKLRPRAQVMAIPVAVLVVLLPAVSIWRNGRRAEKYEHDFGYRLGYLFFQPAGDYPALERNAVLLTGTTVGRDLATYMVFVESFVGAHAKSQIDKCPDNETFDRRDVYLLAPGAWTDVPYRTVIRDQYGVNRPPAAWTNRPALVQTIFRWLGRESIYPAEPIWLPAESDIQLAYRQYLTEFQHRVPQPGEEIHIDKTGRLFVTGSTSLRTINGLITREVFERNKNRHAFYLEPGQVQSWMAPYLEPFGLILKLNSEPVSVLTSEIIARDKAYWSALADELLDNPRFRRDTGAQQAFAQLRAGIAGMYAARQMTMEAEFAYLQALTLCPGNPDVNYQFAQFYMDQLRCNDALEILEAYRHRDPRNIMLRQAIEQVRKRRADLDLIANLERQHALYPDDLSVAMQLAHAYAAAQRLDPFDALVNQLLALPELPEREFFTLININSQLKRADPVLDLLGKFTQRYPQNPIGWFNLALMHGLRGNCTEALPALERALSLDPQLAVAAQQDQRLDRCRSVLQSIRVAGPPIATNAPVVPVAPNH